MQIAEAFVDVRAKTDKFQSDVTKGVTDASSRLKPIEPKADATKAGREIEDKIGAAGTRAGEGAGKGMSAGLLTNARSAVTQLVGLFAGIKIAQKIGDAVQKASDLNEAASLSSRVFGDAQASIDKYGQQAATSFGISKAAFFQATAQLGNLLMNMGFTNKASADLSVKLIKLAADMGSAFNKDPAEALAAIQSGLIGETEPLRQYGVILNENAIKQEAMNLGLYSGKGALDLNAKAQATLSLIMKNTSAIQDDFAKTSDGLANSQRIQRAQAEDAAASMGKNFLPIYTQAVQLIGKLATVFGALPAPIQTGVIALSLFVALIGPLKTAAGVMGDLTKAGIAFARGLGSATPQIALIAGAVAVASAAFLAFRGSNTETERAVRDFTKSIIDSVDNLNLQNLALDGAGAALGHYSDAVNEGVQAKLKDRLESHRQIDDLNRLGVSLDDAYKATGTLAERQQILTDVRRKALETGEVAISVGGKELSIQELQRRGLGDLVDKYMQLGSTYRDNVQGLNVYVTGNTGLLKTFEETTNVASRSTAQLVELAKAHDLDAYAALKARGEVDLLSQADQKWGDAALKAAAKQKEGANASKEDATAKQEATNATEAYRRSADSMAKDVDAATEKVKEQNDAIQTLIDSMLGLFDATFAQHDSQIKFKQAADEATKAALEQAKAGKGNALAQIAAQQSMDDAAEAALDVAKANVRAAEEEAKLQGRTLTAADSQRILIGTLRDLAKQIGGPVGEKLNQMADQLEGIGKQKPKPTVDMNTQPFDSKAIDAQRKADALDKQRPKPTLDATDNATPKIDTATTNITNFSRKSGRATIDVNDYATQKIRDAIRLGQIFAGSSYTADVGVTRTGIKQHGGPIGPGTWLVGEAGAELLRITSTGHGEVIPAEPTRRILEGEGGRGGVVIHGDVIVGTRDDVRALSDELDRHLWLAKNGGVYR